MLIATPVSDETVTYKPVSHLQLMDLTLESIHKAGFSLDKELYSSAREGNVANARYTISDVSDSEMQLQIGWQNSYDKSLSLKFAIGTHVFICANGCVSGDYGSFKKKHTGEIQTFAPNAITEYIKSASEGFRRMQDEREKMKNISLTRTAKAELIGRLILDEGIIKSTQLNIIKKEMDSPSFDYGSPDSMWELYQFVTYSMKEIHPSLWMRDHIDAHNFFTTESGIIISNLNDRLDDIVPNQLDMFNDVEEYTVNVTDELG
jgi:hypothetical protein